VFFASNRAVCGAFQRHNASDLQEEKILVQSRVLQPAEERPGEALRDPEVRHETGQKTTGGDAGPHRRTGDRLPNNDIYSQQLNRSSKLCMHFEQNPF